MGQKVNPHGLRVGVIKDWDSRWFANKADFGDTLVEDYKVREYIMSVLNRRSKNPDIVIGRGGAEIEKLRTTLAAMMNKQVYINIIEVKQPDIDAQLVAEKIAHDLEDRVSFRRAMKQSIGRAMKLGAKGIKTRVSGRLAGAEIARAESYHEGTIPLQTIRADIDYGFAEANTTYGKLGVKVWIYKGEVLKGDAAKAAEKREKSERKPERPDRRRRDDRNGGRRNFNNKSREKREGGNQ